jgi:hypothetical protein
MVLIAVAWLNKLVFCHSRIAIISPIPFLSRTGLELF